MVNIYTDLTSMTGMRRAIKELIKYCQETSDATGLIPTSFSYVQKQLDSLNAMISGLSANLQGLQRLGLHDMTVTIASPTSGAIVSNTVTISGTWTDQSGHTAISGQITVSGVFVTGLVFLASGYWQSSLDTTKYGNGSIPIKAIVICAAGMSKESIEVSYNVANIISQAGSTQGGEMKPFGDTVSLTLVSPGQVSTGTHTLTGSFRSSLGHGIASVSASSNTSAISIGSKSFQGNQVDISYNVDWSSGVEFGVVSVTVTDLGGCQAQGSVRIYNSTPARLIGA